MDARLEGRIDKTGSSPIFPPKQQNVNSRLMLLSKPNTKPSFPVYRSTCTPSTSLVSIPTIKLPPHNVRLKKIGPQKRSQQRTAKTFQLHDHRRIEGKFLYNQLDVVQTNPFEDNPRRVCSNIFFYLWAKNGAGKSCPLVRIPDTIVVQSGCVRFWFFTGKDQQLRRKRREKLEDWRYVLRLFARRTSQGAAGGHQGMRAIHVTYTDKQKLTDDGIQLVGLKEKGLNRMLREGTLGIPDGLLQKYVGSRGPHHTMYVANWQQTLFSVSETLVDINDGSELTGAVGLPPRDVSLTIQTRIKEVCNSIVQHVHQVSPQKYLINELKLHFKLDGGGTLWLMFCSDIKVSNLVFSPPSTIVRTHAYNPFVVPPYFKQSPSLERCARSLRKSTTEDGGDPPKQCLSVVEGSTKFASLLPDAGSTCAKANSVKEVMHNTARKGPPRSLNCKLLYASRRGCALRQERKEGSSGCRKKPGSPQPQTLPRSVQTPLKEWKSAHDSRRRKGTYPLALDVDCATVEDERRSQYQSTLDAYRDWLRKPRPQTAAEFVLTSSNQGGAVLCDNARTNM
ncbi:hypothetical protein BSKO_12115 [Bryopsis sp. KO-2023]|nr:hypothetical protein BSKO_12115 [Bryopsis sp. KO-2023]